MKPIINVLEKLTGYKPTTNELAESILGLILAWIVIIMGMVAIHIFG